MLAHSIVDSSRILSLYSLPLFSLPLQLSLADFFALSIGQARSPSWTLLPWSIFFFIFCWLW